MKIYALSLPDTLKQNEYQILKGFVDQEKKRNLSRFRHSMDQYRSLIGNTLVRAVACQELKADNFDLQFNKSEYGKPYIENYPGFQFNLSHSGKWIVCAVDSDPVGIDIEEMEEVHLDIAERFFTRSEYDYITSIDHMERERFYEIWTLKESFVKAEGKGLSIPLNSFSVTKEKGDLTVKKEEGYRYKYRLHSLSVDDDHKLAVCSSPGQHVNKILFLNISYIISTLSK